MQVVYKYQLSTNTETLIDLPLDAQVLRVDAQGKTVCLWALVTPGEPLRSRVFEVFGTGHQMPIFERKFINTFLISGGAYVFHAFERL